MLNFMTKIFANNISDMTSEDLESDNIVPKKITLEDTQVLEDKEKPRPSVGRNPFKKNSALPKSHDMDPTIELEQPEFDAGTSGEKPPAIAKSEFGRKPIQPGPWNDPTVEVFLPA
jgi:hypothetical protein